ncbi:MAG: hypothetical protein GY792_08180 [Gammaproteobacteria bacterium]|nr:hypothetical protein [Gammaproteobacteria bacterium]
MWRDLRFALLVLLALIVVVASYLGRPMLVFGGVYDPDGKPIAGAFSYSDSSFYSFARDWAEGSESNLIVSGCLFCVELEVRVRADGYESEEIRVSPHHDADPGDRIELRQFAFGMVNWASVTLFPAQDVEPQAYESRMVTRAGQPETVLAVHPLLSGRARYQELGLRIRELTRGRELQAPFIALGMGEGDGAVPASAASGAGVEGADKNTVRLTLNGIDGGFILIPPMDGVPRHDGYRETYRRLRQAPADGYRPSVDLEQRYTHFDGGVFFFYCRIGERYGKGKLSIPHASPSKPDELLATIRIQLNATGGLAMPRGY